MRYIRVRYKFRPFSGAFSGACACLAWLRLAPMLSGLYFCPSSYPAFLPLSITPLLRRITGTFSDVVSVLFSVSAFWTNWKIRFGRGILSRGWIRATCNITRYRLLRVRLWYTEASLRHLTSLATLWPPRNAQGETQATAGPSHLFGSHYDLGGEDASRNFFFFYNSLARCINWLDRGRPRTCWSLCWK